MHNTKNIIILTLILALSLCACTKEKENRPFAIQGVWILERIKNYDGQETKYNNENNSQWLRIYDDSCFYECEKVNAPNGTMFIPFSKQTYTLVDKGKNNYAYMQDDYIYPMDVTGDSTMVIQKFGRKYSWRLTNELNEQKVEAIMDCIKHSMDHDEGYNNRYVISYAESKLETINHTLIYVLLGIVLTMLTLLNYATKLYKKKKHVEQTLKRIEEERVAMPVPVREAMHSVEEDFHKSDFYLSIRKKINSGSKLSQDDWHGIEEQFKSVYPHFISTLLSLYNMSQVELEVCQLIKLNVSPSEMATAICKDASTISSIRSRLYTKVFGKKGSSKDWDEFIHSL